VPRRSVCKDRQAETLGRGVKPFGEKMGFDGDWGQEAEQSTHLFSGGLAQRGSLKLGKQSWALSFVLGGRLRSKTRTKCGRHVVIGQAHTRVNYGWPWQ